MRRKKIRKNNRNAPATPPSPPAMPSRLAFCATSAFASSISSLTSRFALAVTSLTMSPSCFSASPLAISVTAPGQLLQQLGEDERAHEGPADEQLRLLAEGIVVLGGLAVGGRGRGAAGGGLRRRRGLRWRRGLLGLHDRMPCDRLPSGDVPVRLVLRLVGHALLRGILVEQPHPQRRGEPVRDDRRQRADTGEHPAPEEPLCQVVVQGSRFNQRWPRRRCLPTPSRRIWSQLPATSPAQTLHRSWGGSRRSSPRGAARSPRRSTWRRSRRRCRT